MTCSRLGLRRPTAAICASHAKGAWRAWDVGAQHGARAVSVSSHVVGMMWSNCGVPHVAPGVRRSLPGRMAASRLVRCRDVLEQETMARRTQSRVRWQSGGGLGWWCMHEYMAVRVAARAAWHRAWSDWALPPRPISSASWLRLQTGSARSTVVSMAVSLVARTESEIDWYVLVDRVGDGIGHRGLICYQLFGNH